MAKFSKGDRVVVRSTERSSFRAGVDIGTILVVDENESEHPYVAFEDGRYAGVLYEDDADLYGARATTALPEGLRIETTSRYFVDQAEQKCIEVRRALCGYDVLIHAVNGKNPWLRVEKSRIPALIAALQAFID